MFEQIDHRGKRFTISDENSVDDVARERCRRAELLERQAQGENRELERAKAVAGSDSTVSDSGVFDR
ncbi:hypothetical protein RBH26_14505 [Natronolimnohabitans sp. A-GB9]|uniref:hypothetical protein n=1 Tax=Natronolimnohabitans sp. A-GB9 TaxID=3069757 RepID=UPI0027B23650|nr:hypothetical protein [Natronolimnohabitans sp. A-GB9]MDQ2051688.1 hypothetical protein [Natronolimnohabitans sp. A-GB9]